MVDVGSSGGSQGYGLDTWRTAKSDMSAGDSLSDLIENATPPLVIISSRVKSPGHWEAIEGEGRGRSKAIEGEGLFRGRERSKTI